MDGPFMGSGADSMDSFFSTLDPTALAFGAGNPFTDEMNIGPENIDFSQFFFEMDPSGAQTFELPMPADQLPYTPDQSDVPCNLLNDTAHPLKRPQSDDEDNNDDRDNDRDDINASPTKSKKPRLKAIKNGYRCTPCGMTFDRAGDLNKHQNRKHASDDQKPCGCTHCDKRFLYPKDVARHNRQIHGIVGEMIQRMSTHAGPSRLQHDPDGKPSSMTIATALWFGRSIVMLKGRLRLRRKSSVDAANVASASFPAPAGTSTHRFVMVTTDKRNFRVLDVAAVTSHDGLLEAVRSEFDLMPQHGLTVYRHHLGSNIEEPMTTQQTMTALAKYADANASLKLYLSTIKSEPEDV